MHVRVARQCRATYAAQASRKSARPDASDRRQWYAGCRGKIDQQPVDDRLVVSGHRVDGGGQCEDHVVVLHGQQASLTCVKPLVRRAHLALRAMVVAQGRP
jgi:hypothetical protein